MILKFSTAESLRAATYLSPAIKCSRSTNFNVSSTTFWPQQSPKNNLFYYNRNILAKLKEGIFRLIFKLKAMINGHQIESQYIRRLCDQWLYYMSNCVIYLKAYFCMSGLDPYWTTDLSPGFLMNYFSKVIDFWVCGRQTEIEIDRSIR